MFNEFTYLIAAIQIIIGLIIIIGHNKDSAFLKMISDKWNKDPAIKKLILDKWNKDSAFQKLTSDNESTNSQIPIIGVMLIGLGDLILIIILLISGG
jgi:hypothetical protein